MLAARMGLDEAQLRRSGSPSVLLGTPEQMREQLLQRRDALGVSYITVADMHMDALAPVVEQLAGS